MSNDNDKNNNMSGNSHIPLRSRQKRDLFEARLHEVKRTFWIHMTAARIIFKSDTDILIQLLLNETRMKNLHPWAQGAKECYRRILNNEEVTGKLVEYGIPREEMELCLMKIKDLEVQKLWRIQVQKEWGKGEYEFQEAWKKFKDWMADFEDASYQAMEDQPELLVRMGMEKSVEDAIQTQEKRKRRKWKERMHGNKNDNDQNEKNNEETGPPENGRSSGNQTGSLLNNDVKNDESSHE
ncbi:MAG: hypothetical protein GY940_03290 [bacterium]|nr:hypothetical protein [bacterium]